MQKSLYLFSLLILTYAGHSQQQGTFFLIKTTSKENIGYIDFTYPANNTVKWHEKVLETGKNLETKLSVTLENP